MSTDLLYPTELRTFEDILDDLERLSRDHLLFYRIEVGRVLLGSLFGGDAHAYLDRNPAKEARFAQFVSQCAPELARYGLRENAVRECIVCHIVFEGLPQAVRQTLFYSQVLELSRLADATARARLAVAAVEGDWTVVQLRDAVGAVKAGLPYDADATANGAPTPEPTHRAQPGRLVSRAEKWTSDLDAWTAQWAAVDKARLRGAQRKRVVAAVAAAQARLTALAEALGG